MSAVTTRWPEPAEQSNADLILEQRATEQDCIDRVTYDDVLNDLGDSNVRAAMDQALLQGSVEMAGRIIINLRDAMGLRMAAEWMQIGKGPSNDEALAKAMLGRGVR
jgi:hypothetical protein